MNLLKKYLVGVFFVVFLCTITNAQQLYYPLNHNISNVITKNLPLSKKYYFTAVKPLLQSTTNREISIERIIYEAERDSAILNRAKHPWFWKKLRTENLVFLKHEDFLLMIDPLFHFQYGRNTITDSLTNINTRGVIAKGHIGKKLSFETRFYENQAVFVDYVDTYVRQQISVPGQGVPKDFGTLGHDFSMSSGYVSFSPIPEINIHFGHGKHFIGDGYRSLLLSDNSSNYPFLKLTGSYKWFYYMTMFTSFMDFRDLYWEYHRRKHGTFTYMAFIPVKQIEIGFFEGIIWQTTFPDEGKNRKFHADFFKPIIFARAKGLGLDSTHNAVYGTNLKVRVSKNIHLYGQFMVDDVQKKHIFDSGYFKSKFGYQFGVKYFDVSGLKNLNFQFEFNKVSPYSYAHRNEFQNYSHLNLPLAHPLGAGFTEQIVFADYTLKDFNLKLHYSYAMTSSDSTGTHFGTNIFMSDYDATIGMDATDKEIGQGLKTFITHKGFRFSYLINPRTRMQLYLAYDNRNYQVGLKIHETNYFTIGFRTYLNNYYFDF